MLEGKVQADSVAHARSTGWWARKFKAQGRRSLPDYVFAKQGRVIFDEFKATGEGPTELQEEEHKKMRAAGLTVWVHDDPEKFKQSLAEENRKLEDWL